MNHKYALIILICLSCVGIATADEVNITVHLHGAVLYDDMTAIPVGSEIIALTHSGQDVGRMTTTVDGKYGSASVFDNKDKLQITAEYGDQVYFYVNGIRSPDMFSVTSSGDFAHDITVAVPSGITLIPTVDYPQTGEIVPEPEVTTEVTTEVQPTSLLDKDIDGAEIWVLGGIIATFIGVIGGYLLLAYITRDDNDGNALK